MKCPFCHTRIDDDSKFCPNCGGNLNNICPNCGQENNYESTFCKKCGARLREEAVKEAKPNKEKKQKDARNFDKVSRIFSLVSMSLMILSLALCVGFIFTPFRTDDFFNPYSSTLINYISTAFSANFNDKSDYSSFVSLGNGIILLSLMLATVLPSVIFLVIDLPKFIKCIKNKEYQNFTKHVVIVFALYLATYIYFSNIVTVSQSIVFDSNIGPSFAPIIIIPIILVFNLFSDEFNKNEHNLFAIIIRSTSKLLLFVFLMIVLFNLGNIDFSIQATIMNNNGKPFRDNLILDGYFGEISYFINRSNYLYKGAIPLMTKVYLMSALALVFELITMIFIIVLIKKLFSASISKQFKTIPYIIYSSVILVVAILALAFTNMIGPAIVALDDIELYGMLVSSLVINSSYQVLMVVLSSIIFLVAVAMMVIERIMGDRLNEKNN